MHGAAHLDRFTLGHAAQADHEVRLGGAAVLRFEAMKIVELSPRKGLKLFLRYEDGASGEVDLSSLAGRGVFAPWLDPAIFEQVRLSDAGAPEWPGEVDLCPDALYMRLTGKAPEEVFPSLRTISADA